MSAPSGWAILKARSKAPGLATSQKGHIMCTSRATLRVTDGSTSWLLCESCAMDAFENHDLFVGALRTPSYVQCGATVTLVMVPAPASYVPTSQEV